MFAPLYMKYAMECSGRKTVCYRLAIKTAIVGRPSPGLHCTCQTGLKRSVWMELCWTQFLWTVVCPRVLSLDPLNSLRILFTSIFTPSTNKRCRCSNQWAICARNALHYRVADISSWCTFWRLHLDASKTELIWFGSRQSLAMVQPANLILNIGSEVIQPVNMVSMAGNCRSRLTFPRSPAAVCTNSVDCV